MRKILMLLLCGAAIATNACGSGGADKAPVAESRDQAVSLNGAGEPKKRAATDGAAPARPEIGRCHADACSWSVTKGRSIVAQDARGTLVRLSLLGGTSDNMERDAGKARIRWNSKPHEVYIFCSNRLPAVIVRNDVPPELAKAGGGHRFPPYQVDVLDFVNGVPGALESSANLFVRTCYPNDDWNSADFARRNGLSGFDDLPDVAITSPEGIFQAAEQMRAD